MNNLLSLFLSQSYKDAWDDYIRSINNENFICWDYVILTASNEQQANGFMIQIDERRKNGLLPPHTRFSVIADPDGKRVGSGGATLNVLKYIAKEEKTSDFKNKRILVIHSGGDSKRVPQYSALGKLFSPVPHELANGRPSTLFDEFMIGMSGVPSRMKEGMLLLSGDVLLLLNPLQIDFSGNGAAAISFKEDAETGKNHGVFLNGADGNVCEFLHKQTVETLTAKGAVNNQGNVDIDTGAIIFSSEILKSLYSLISTNGEYDENKFNNYVNDTVRLSLYGDFLYPLATASSLTKFYEEKPEGSFCQELTAARTKVWEVLRPYRMKLLRLSPAKFIHFGTTREIMKLVSKDIVNYEYLGWSKNVSSSVATNFEGLATYNSILAKGAVCGPNSYLEVSHVHSDARIGSNVVLSYVDIHNETIPDNVVLHGLKQKDGKFVCRIYGIEDNPKDTLESKASFLGSTLDKFLEINNININELWSNDEHYLWFANLYPACDTIDEAVKHALNIYAMVSGNGNVSLWRNASRKSLMSGFNDADAKALTDWDQRMNELICMENIFDAINQKQEASYAKKFLNATTLTNKQQIWLEDHISKVDFSTAIRLYYYVGLALGGAEGERYIGKCFSLIGKGILDSTLTSVSVKDCRICRDELTVKLPLRVNWGGGWSDTPPYCNEAGGTVLNAAISLNGELPVSVTIKKLVEKKIIFESRDMGTYGEFTDLSELQRYGDPYDSFALQKAALLACGVIPMTGSSMTEVLDRIGGGFYMNTEVTGVPKGSGLGTSSILAGACVKALFQFMGIAHNDSDLYDHVLCMEQIMSTGGGWQDQVGGLSNGIKYITSKPGMHQKINVDYVTVSPETIKELNDRFVIIYTGQRRLARNLLRDVVGRYIGNVPDAVNALYSIQELAALMRFELERGNIDALASLFNRHWEMSKQLDMGSTNTCIDQIFSCIEEFIDGKMICGAGGGGFLQVILKKDVSKSEVSKRLHDVFQDSGVDVWDSELIF